MADVILETSARFMASMAAFNEETIPSSPSGRCDVVTIFETRDSHEGVVWLLLL